MVSDQAGRGIAVVVTTHGVSARFRTLIRNVTAGTEGLERDPSWPLTVHDTPWHGSKGWQMRGPGRTTGSHQAIGKESNKKILDVNDGGLLVIGKRELKRETTLDAWLNSNFPWVNNFRDIYIQHSLILWGLGITPDTGILEAKSQVNIGESKYPLFILAFRVHIKSGQLNLHLLSLLWWIKQ